MAEWKEKESRIFMSSRNSGVDRFLRGGQLESESTRSVLAMYRAASRDHFRVSGTRVAFSGNEFTAFVYDPCPSEGEGGTVVTVRTACGDLNRYEGRVFVLWDSGRLVPVYSRHLRRVKTSKKHRGEFRLRVADVDLLTAFVKRGDDLVHKATKDLWALREDNGQYVIERLFEDNGQPLRV